MLVTFFLVSPGCLTLGPGGAERLTLKAEGQVVTVVQRAEAEEED